MTTREMALQLAKNNWPVFPVKPGGKAPLGRLAPHGCKDATTNPTKVNDWWSVVPSANIGVPTGSIFAVDEDIPGAWDELSDGQDVPETLVVRTPSGGRHFYFRAPEGVQVKNSAGKLAEGIDVRGKGGYTVFPPSETDAGAYRFINCASVAPAPDWLVKELTSSTNGAAQAPQPVEGTIPEGQRNDTLFRMGCAMRRKGFSKASIETALQQENASRCAPALSDEEVRKVARSAARYDPADVPRGLRSKLRRALQIDAEEIADVEQMAPEELQRYLKLKVSNETAGKEVAEKGNGGEAPVEYRPFPLDLLPDPVRRYVRAASEALPAAPAMVGVPALAALSAAIGSTARIRLKRSWTEPATIWTTVVAPSGSTKSPALRHALRPIYRREREARKAHEKAMKRYEQAKARDEDPERPVRRRYRTGDATPEAIAAVLSENRRGVLLARDELAAWIGSFDRYVNGAADLQFWIEVHQGLPVSVDRKSTGNISLDRPAVPVTGTIQPGTLREKLGEIHFDTGFAARLLLVMPPAVPKRWTEADVTREVSESYSGLLRTLYDVSAGTVMDLTPEAKTAFASFVDANGEEVFEMDEGPARAVAAKTEMHAARLTLLIHLARRAVGETGSDEVDATSMQRGIALARWLRDETFRVYEVLELATEAMPPKQRFYHELPDEFKTSTAEALSEKYDVTARTIRNWLKELTGRGDLEKVRRGLYRKVYPVSSFRNFRNVHKERVRSGRSVKKAEAKEKGNGQRLIASAEDWWTGRYKPAVLPWTLKIASIGVEGIGS